MSSLSDAHVGVHDSSLDRQSLIRMGWTAGLGLGTAVCRSPGSGSRGNLSLPGSIFLCAEFLGLLTLQFLCDPSVLPGTLDQDHPCCVVGSVGE